MATNKSLLDRYMMNMPQTGGKLPRNNATNASMGINKPRKGAAGAKYKVSPAGAKTLQKGYPTNSTSIQSNSARIPPIDGKFASPGRTIAPPKGNKMAKMNPKVPGGRHPAVGKNPKTVQPGPRAGQRIR